jgi:hypothetical protein
MIRSKGGLYLLAGDIFTKLGIVVNHHVVHIAGEAGEEYF